MNYQVWILAVLLPCALSVVPISHQEEDYGPPQPYTFGYKVHDIDGDQWRAEKSDGHGRVEGSYGYVDNLGMTREVHYIADDGGFRANIKTNEPGMDSPNPADVILHASPPSDYDANIYGIEAIPRNPIRRPSMREAIPRNPIGRPNMREAIPRNPEEHNNVHKQLNDEEETKVIEIPSRHNSKGFYKYHRFAEQSVPPIYVVDGHLQSPWFPMDSAQLI